MLDNNQTYQDIIKLGNEYNKLFNPNTGLKETIYLLKNTNDDAKLQQKTAELSTKQFYNYVLKNFNNQL